MLEKDPGMFQDPEGSRGFARWELADELLIRQWTEWLEYRWHYRGKMTR